LPDIYFIVYGLLPKNQTFHIHAFPDNCLYQTIPLKMTDKITFFIQHIKSFDFQENYQLNQPVSDPFNGIKKNSPTSGLF